MTWGFLWLMLALKIPLAGLIYIVWWAIKQEPEERRRRGTMTAASSAAAPHPPQAVPAPAAPRPARRSGAAAAGPGAHHARPGARRWATDRLRNREQTQPAQPPRSVGGLRSASSGRLAAMNARRAPSCPTARSCELVEEGRIRIEPWDPALVQPASVDLRLGDSFRVFHNHRASAIDLRQPPENLTEEVVVPRRRVVRHPPGRVLPRAHARVGRAARRHRGADRGEDRASAASA